MDPNKPATARPADWNSGEKSGMGPQPPPYQDYAAGYNPPPGVYPNQTGYPQVQSGYPQVQPGYPQGQPGYPQVQPGYPQGQPYGAPYGQPLQAPYTDQPSVVVQPTVYIAPAPLAHPLPDYLGYSIFTMLCCCLPLGVAALIFSIHTRDANRTGQRPLAERYSRLARTLNNTALGIGLTVLVLYIILIIMQVAALH